MHRKIAFRSHDVLVIAESVETLDGLLGYLNDAGVRARGRHTLAAMSSVDATRAAVVIFPDGFARSEVIPTIRAIRTHRSDLLVLLVTGDSPRFQDVVRPLGRSTPPQVLPKPVFGWTILDAVRHHISPISQGS